MEFGNLFASLAAILNEMSPYILLGFVFAGILHVFVNRGTMARHLRGNGAGPVVKAALFGIPLPLCSCGVLPAAVSLRRQGASRAAATSFLIATPQTGVDSIAATYSLLGLPFAIIRPVAALAGAVFGGLAVGRASAGDDRTELKAQAMESDDSFRHMGFFRKCIEAVRYGLVDMVASIGKWLVIGLVVAALITAFVPDSIFISLNRYPLLAMLAMVLVAVPMYVCATGSIPIALSLMLKGLSPGIAFVLLMAGPAANFASVMVLRRSMGGRATAVYIGSVVATAILFGLIIDYALPAAWFVPSGNVASSCHGEIHFGIFESACSALLLLLLAYA
ncbi:MAG: SO_0444 family Cu/Zn efflux transporter, partial [Muribaculaceae bacterium]|nr:SO_0444 family Cu/Zn efflux transporter [Muribaculaceae bacterium]